MRDLRKYYGPREVIHGVSLDIDDGEFVVLVGPSGCGKSTLLRMIAGLEDISSGELKIGGRVVNDEHPKDRDIAMVFQTYALYPHMTVAENLGFSLRMRKFDQRESQAKVQRAAEILNLVDLLERYPRQLSGGQRQRVAMGRAIVRDPKVFLFDEPLSNLDAKLRVQMRAEIRELHQRLKATIVYVTHDQIEAMTMADKIVVMNAGKVEQLGSPLDLYDSPSNLFVAGFLGSPGMNFLRGRAFGGPQEAWFETESGARLALPPTPGLPTGRDLVMGFRPEHLEVSEMGSAFEVAVVEPTGSELHVILKFGGDHVTAVFRDRLPLHLGEDVRLSLQPGRLHFFDPATEQRMAVSEELGGVRQTRLEQGRGSA